MQTDTGAPKERLKILDGRVTLYKRDGSRNWYAEFSIPGEGQLRKPLRTDSLTLAREAAEDIFYEARKRKAEGKPVRQHTFKSVATEFIGNLKTQIEQGELPNHRLKEVAVINRYFIPFFGSSEISDVNKASIAKWVTWRKDYWFTGPGQNERAITYQRGGKVLIKPFNPRPVSAQRLKLEHNMLRAIFRYAQDNGYISELPKSPTFSQPTNRRPDFSPDEFRLLLDVAENRFSTGEMVKNPHVRNSRIKLWCFINLLAFSGLRVTEAHKLKWNAIVWKRNCAIGEQDVYIRTYGKGHEGIVHPHLAVTSSLEVLWALTAHERGREPLPDEHLFSHSDGSPIMSFKKGLAELLEKCGLLFDNQGRRRSAGCFRHFYATQQLLHGVEPLLLAKAMRTTQKMIENYYGHITPSTISNRIRPEWNG